MKELDKLLAGLPAHDYESAQAVAADQEPFEPVHLFRPKMIIARTAVFQEALQGVNVQLAYAIRANPEPKILQVMDHMGMGWYACDTLSEIEIVRKNCPDAKVLFLHPVKSPEAIDAAYHKHRVRHFVVDHMDELHKVMAHTENDCTIMVRLSGPPGALLGEGYRFGCSVHQAVELCQEIVKAGYKLGLSFHLGSQVMDPQMYDEGFLILREVMYRARFMLDCVCLGGGFPAIYDDLWPPPMKEYLSVVRKGLARLHLPRTCQVFLTPGRALVADSVAVLVRVEQRRGATLYINDGQMGSLGSINVKWWRPPVRLVRLQGKVPENLLPFRLAGAACYGNDIMPGPFFLPGDTQAGDYIEMGQLGAYSGSIFTAFHSLPWPEMVSVLDDPPVPHHQGVLPFHKSVEELVEQLGGEHIYDEELIPEQWTEDGETVGAAPDEMLDELDDLPHLDEDLGSPDESDSVSAWDDSDTAEEPMHPMPRQRR